MNQSIAWRDIIVFSLIIDVSNFMGVAYWNIEIDEITKYWNNYSFYDDDFSQN